MSTASRQQRSKSREAPSVERKASARVKKIYTNRSGPIATRPTNLKTSLSQYQTKSQESLQNKPKKMELTKVGKLVKIQPKKDQIQNTISDFLSPAITDTRNQDLNMTPEVESFIMTSEDGSLKRSKSIKRQSGKSTKGQSTLKSQSQSDLKQSPNGRRSRYSHSLEEKAKFNRGYKQLCQVTDLKQQQSKDSIESGNYTEMQTEIKASNGAQTPFSQFIDTERQNLTDIQLNSRSQNITFQEEPFRDQTQSYNQENQQIKAISEEDDEAILSKVRSNRSGRSVQALRNNICFNSGRSQQNLKNSSSAYQYLRLNSATSQSNLQVVCVIKKTDVHKGNKCAASAKDSVPSFAQAQNHNQLNKKQDMLVSSSTPGAYCFRARPKIAPLMKVLLKDPSDFITCQQVFSKSDSQTIESTTNLAKLEKPDYKLYKFDSVICEPQGHNIQTSLYKDYWHPIFNVPTLKNTKAQLVLLFGTTDSKKQQLLQLSGVQSNSKEFDNSLVGAQLQDNRHRCSFTNRQLLQDFKTFH